MTVPPSPVHHAKQAKVEVPSSPNHSNGRHLTVRFKRCELNTPFVFQWSSARPRDRLSTCPTIGNPDSRPSGTAYWDRRNSIDVNHNVSVIINRSYSTHNIFRSLFLYLFQFFFFCQCLQHNNSVLEIENLFIFTTIFLLLLIYIFLYMYTLHFSIILVEIGKGKLFLL